MQQRWFRPHIVADRSELLVRSHVGGWRSTGLYDDRDSVYGDLVMSMTSDGRAGDGRNRRRDAAVGGGPAVRMRETDDGSLMVGEKNGAAIAPFPAVQLAAPLPEHLTRCLRAMYDDVLDEPVPDRFRQLLEELDRQQGAADAAD
ncbi:NepR family anti-sigma factor [Chelatococcus sambhunathii]